MSYRGCLTNRFGECMCDACGKMKPEREGTFLAFGGRARFVCNGCAPIDTERNAARHYTQPLPF